MKKIIFSLLGATVAFGIIACNNDSTTTGTTDSTANITTNTTSNVGNYAAKADSIRVNSEAGNYLNPKTGKPMKLTMDVSTGKVTNAETGEPVWRYVDRRNWWVYGGENWDNIGQAKMEKDQIWYQGDGDKWMTYDDTWKSEDEKLEQDWKVKNGDTKIKVSKDGDVKIKDEQGKTKVDGETGKVKVDSSK